MLKNFAFFQKIFGRLLGWKRNIIFCERRKNMLGENIYKLRKEKKLSQEQLAEMVGVTRQTISNWELKETSPNTEQLKALSRALNISIDELLDNDINSVLIEKVSNTEKLAGIVIKILKVGVVFFFLLFIVDIISLVLFAVFKNNEVILDKQEISVNCIKENTSYLITVSTDGDFSCEDCSSEIKKDIRGIIDSSSFELTLRNVENYFENQGGSCK